MKNLQNILNSPKKTLSIILLLIFIAAVPLTVFISQKQQDIRQRAVEVKDVALYFADGPTKDDKRITNLYLNPDQQKTVYLNLDTKGKEVVGFSVDVEITGLDRLEVLEGVRAREFDQTGFPLGFSGSHIKFSKLVIDGVTTPGKVTGVVDLFSIKFTAKTESGRFNILSESEVAIKSRTDEVSIDSSSLSFSIPSTPGPSDAPTPTQRPYASCTETDFGCIPNDPIGFVTKFYGIGLGFIGGIALLFIIYGGYLVMTSRGNPGQLAKGKSIILYAVIGLFLGIFGFIFVRIIAGDILKIPGFG